VLQAPTLEAAVRGSDMYVKRKVLHHSPKLYSMMSRHAKWRQARASDRQRQLVEKRLGLSRTRASPDEGADAAHARPVPPTEHLTKGQASVILTRLLHGARARWQHSAKASNRIWRRNQRELARTQRETVRVGPLH
jgi:ATP-dependent helicase IRC3